MIEVRVVTGCRRTFRQGQGLSEVPIPCYLKTTLQSVSESDIPRDTVGVFVDSLGANILHNPKHGTLTMQKVTYGAAGGQEVDVTPKVAAAITDGRVFLCATNDYAGGDPAPGTRKRMRIDYSVAGVARSYEMEEGEVLLLSAADTVLDSSYTAHLSRLAKRYKIPVYVSRGGELNTHLPEVLRHPAREDFLLILEDDVEVDRDIYEKVALWLKNDVPDLVFGSLLNLWGDATVVPADQFYSAQAIVIRSDAIPKILYLIEHYDLVPGAQAGWMDIILSRIAGYALRAPIHVYPQSLVKHIGIVSKWKE